MNSVIGEKIRDKKIGILGFGREGKSSLRRVMKVGGYKSVTVIDARDVSGELPTGVFADCGDFYLDNLNSYDVIFKTPGVVLPKSPSDYTCEFTSQTELFISCYKDRVIGITGTKGKSTTSSLLYHVLKQAGKDVLFAGNIGIPVFEIADEINKDSVIVIELSCHQLEYAKTCPHISLLLNIFEDHLDHYGTREKYGLAKKNIYINQSSDDYLFTTKETMLEWGEGIAKTEFVVKDNLPFETFEEIGAGLKGEHNLLNAAFVYKVAGMYGVDDECFVKAVASFKTLPHRLEHIGCFEGIDYYDDSISTTVKSAVSAVESVANSAIILVGGMERNIAYEELVEYFSKCKLKYIICMYESGKRIYEMYEKVKNKGVSPESLLVDDLEEAVKTAKRIAVKGDAVLLSPAAASYGYFKNFEERGDRFSEMVKKSK